MSQEKKLVLFFAIVFLWMIGATQFSRFMGWLPAPKKPPAVAAANDAEAQAATLPRTPLKAKATRRRQAEDAAKAEGDAAGRPASRARPATKPAERARDRAGQQLRAGARLDQGHGRRGPIASAFSSSRRGRASTRSIPRSTTPSSSSASLENVPSNSSAATPRRCRRWP